MHTHPVANEAAMDTHYAHNPVANEAAKDTHYAHISGGERSRKGHPLCIHIWLQVDFDNARSSC